VAVLARDRGEVGERRALGARDWSSISHQAVGTR
jgi:hypothetical protein